MKIVKLNGRYRQFREHRHTIGLRFDSYTQEAVVFERACHDCLPGSGNGWTRSSDWYTYFGDRPNTNSPRPFWITFRNEQDLTWVLLSVDINKARS